MTNHPIQTLAFDADDTLWHNETFFKLTQDRFEDLLAPYCETNDLHTKVLETERRNIARYGFGVKGFTLSLIETAIEVTDGNVPTGIIQTILDNGRDLLAHPVDLLPGVGDTLEHLAGRFPLILVTKGDLLHQEEKLAASGLGPLFANVHIVSQKDPATYARVLDRPQATMMVGNSMKSDILPVLKIGGWATFVPFEIEWEMERAAAPDGHDRYHTIPQISRLPAVLDQL